MLDMVSFTYLVRVSIKYGIDTFKFLKSVNVAWIRGESSCESISIKRREMTKDEGSFLITQDRRIIAQVKLSSTVLDYMVKPEVLKLRFKGYTAPKQNTLGVEDLEIKDLNSETRRFNLHATVTEKSQTRTVESRWGETLLLSTATIRDQTGTIKLPLWRDQIGKVSVGDRLRIENARLKRFRGELQVKLDRLARIQVVDTQQTPRPMS